MNSREETPAGDRLDAMRYKVRRKKMRDPNERFFPKQNPEAIALIWSDPCPIHITGFCSVEAGQGKAVLFRQTKNRVLEWKPVSAQPATQLTLPPHCRVILQGERCAHIFERAKKNLNFEFKIIHL